MGVTFSGGSGFEHFLDAKINVGTEVIEVVKRNGAQMQQRAQSLAPVDTGFLKRDITLSFTNAGVEFAAAISGDAEYAPCFDRAKCMVTCVLGLTKIGENLII